jgi:hypothetical protein
MSEIYQHTQVGVVMLVVLAFAGAGLLWAGIQEGWPAGLASGLGGALAAIAACLVLFTTLTVRIGDGVIAVRFGPGFPRRVIRIDDIASARAVRNPWCAGYGIHWVGSGWLYNVSGRDAVEVALTSGRTVRIGTDEPEELLRALGQAGVQTLTVVGGAERAV